MGPKIEQALGEKKTQQARRDGAAAVSMKRPRPRQILMRAAATNMIPHNHYFIIMMAMREERRLRHAKAQQPHH